VDLLDVWGGRRVVKQRVLEIVVVLLGLLVLVLAVVST
jgi:hypothetical protein